MNWKLDASEQLLVSELNKRLGLSEKGEVKLTLGPDFDLICQMLAKGFSFSNEVSQRKTFDLVRRSVINMKKRDALRCDSLSAEIRRLEGEYLSQRPESFALVGTISLQYWDQLKGIRLLNKTITFSRFPPKKYVLDQHSNRWSRISKQREPHFATVVVRMSARDALTAAEKAFEALDYLRGIWNLFLNYRRVRVQFGGGKRPVNPVVIGKVQTVHSANGRMVRDFWFENHFADQVHAHNIRDNYENLKKFEQFVRAQIRKAKYKGFLISALQRYARALDQMDAEASFLKLWSLLEWLTSAERKSDHIIKRGAFLFHDASYQRRTLEYLRSTRNLMVHADQEHADADSILNGIKRYVEAVLMFAVRNAHSFGSREELTQCLALPTNVSELERQIWVRRFAQQLMSR